MYNVQTRQLSRIGGATVREQVSGIMKRLLTNQLAAQFNLKGKGGKMALAKLTLYRVIVG